MGGAGGYLVKRIGDDLDLYAWSQSDGACPDGKGGVTSCPASEKAIAKIPIPSGVKITERILMISGPNQQQDLECEPP